MAINPEKIQKEQVQRFNYLPLGVLNYSASGLNNVITTQLTSAASANTPYSVPLQVSTDVETMGYVTSPPWNKCLIQDPLTDSTFDDGFGNEVYGRITEAGAVYTLTYYSIQKKPQIHTLVFDAPLVTGNLIDGDINATPINQVPFNTDNATTLSDLAAEIQSDANIETAVSNGTDTITITSVTDVSVTLANFIVTGGASQAGTTVTETQALQIGAETNVNIGSRNIDFFPIYNFDFPFVPTEAFIRIKGRNTGDDPSGASGGTKFEKLNVTALNTVSNLTFTPVPGSVRLYVNPAGPYTEGVAFTVAGKTITWLPAGAGFDIKTTFTVKAAYSTLES